MKKSIIQAIALTVFYSYSLDCSFSQNSLTNRTLEFLKSDCINELPPFVGLGTPGVTSSGSTPNSTKQRGAAFSSLTLSLVEPILQDELKSETRELERKINSFDMTPASTYWLGKKLLLFKQKNANNDCAIDLIELLHNRAAAPLKHYFKDENGQFDKSLYNNFLEKSLPRICDESQDTPLVTPDIKKLNISQEAHNRSRRNSIFENY